MEGCTGSVATNTALSVDTVATNTALSGDTVATNKHCILTNKEPCVEL